MENQNVIATGFNLPPYWLKDKVVFINYQKDSGKMSETTDFSGIREQYPLRFSNPNMIDFAFPIDPFISLSFKNSITRRQVAKGSTRGTIKESWTQDDVEITISGIFIGENGNYPEDEVDWLQRYFDLHQSVGVSCDMLNKRDINQIVIESLELPFTKGTQNQAFQIKAYSDDVFHLLKQTNNAV
jgi:hypothetical protein